MTEEQVNEMYQLARGFCRNKHIWYDDDLIQELVMHLYDKRDKYDETKGSFSTFAYMCFRNFLYDRKKCVCGAEILVENVDEVFCEECGDIYEKLIVQEVMKVIQDDPIMTDWVNGVPMDEIAQKQGKHRTTISRYIAKRIEELKNEYVGG